MSSTSKRRQTMAKREREAAVRTRRAQKLEKKRAKAAARRAGTDDAPVGAVEREERIVE